MLLTAFFGSTDLDQYSRLCDQMVSIAGQRHCDVARSPQKTSLKLLARDVVANDTVLLFDGCEGKDSPIGLSPDEVSF